MAPAAKRLASALAIASQDSRLRVTDIETRYKTRFTADTLAVLTRRFPRARFVWLMGADNLLQIAEWQRWPAIFGCVPVAVFARPTYTQVGLSSIAAQRFARNRCSARAAARLADATPPAWCFLPIRLEKLSATYLRQLAQTQTSRRKTRGEATITTETAVPLARPSATPRAIADLVLHVLDEGKAEEIREIDLRGKSSIADYMLIASGRSSRQVAALATQVTDKLRDLGLRHPSVEGKAQGDWVLIDAGDVIVHLFRPEVRAYYNLEKMWGVQIPPGEELRSA
jgi:nicotinate-nucleotide adenylyltransferase